MKFSRIEVFVTLVVIDEEVAHSTWLAFWSKKFWCIGAIRHRGRACCRVVVARIGAIPLTKQAGTKVWE